MKRRTLGLLAIVLVAGCAAVTAPPPITAVGNAIARAEARTQSARDRISEAKPHANPTGQALLGGADSDLAAAGGDHQEAAQQLAEAAKETQKWKERAERAERHWGYVWGKRIERWITWIVLLWAGLGIVSIVTGVLAGPLTTGTLARIGVGIIRILPLATPFSLIRDFLRARRGWVGM